MKKTKKHDAVVFSSGPEREIFSRFTKLLKSTPLPDEELLPNLGLYLTSKNLSRILCFYEIYKKILNSHGIIIEFGVRWGQTLSLMSALRGIFEPFNRHRKIIGFDTFEGFKGIGKEDGDACRCCDGSYSVPPNYEEYLADVMQMQEQLNPIPHLRKFEVIKGDALETIPEYLRRHPETIVSLVIFDFDIYRPTKAALEAILPHLTKGSILVFDELCDDIFPGETIALREVFRLHDIKIQRLPMTSRISWIELE